MNNWKIHFWWVLILGVLLLICVVTFWVGGKGNEIVSYVSFASALISIILALVAIFYSIVQHTSSQQNIGEMRTLVSQASHTITEKAFSIEQHSVAMSRIALSIAQSIGTVLPPNDATFHLNVSNCSHSGLLALYGLAKSYKHSKPLIFLEFVKRYYPDSNIQFIMCNYLAGLMIGFSCFLEPGSVVIDLVSIKANKLPSAFEEYIIKHIEARIQQEAEPMKIFLQNSRLAIDSYFEAV